MNRRPAFGARWSWRRGVVIGLFVASVTSCGNETTPNALDPSGDEAQRTAQVWWILLALGGAVAVVVIALIVYGSLRNTTPRVLQRTSDDKVVVIGGIVIPGLILLVVAGLTISATVDLRPAEGSEDALRVEVIGHRWWWEVRYPDLDIEIANEVHFPTDRPVELSLTSADVVHSFWVPQLAGKMDLVPGDVNRLEISADEPGTYWGPCAEYCGLQHATMNILAVAMTPQDFEVWVGDRTEPPVGAPEGEPAVRGQGVFLTMPCGGCHRIEGTPATGERGPDLTYVGARQQIGAGAVTNTPEHLARWIQDASHYKPGVLMPPFPQISDEDVDALVAYLSSLGTGGS